MVLKMGFSELKYKIDAAKARHEYEKSKLALQHSEEMKKLVAQCNHKYEDGTSAVRYWEGHSRMDFGKECAICGNRNVH